MITRTAQVGPLAAASANGYTTTQAGVAGTPLTLNGSLVTGGVGIPDKPRRLTVTSAGNDSANFFTITGQSIVNGPIVTEVMPGATGVATSALNYAKVISIVPTSNTAANVTAGTSAVASSDWIRLDNYGSGPISLEVDVTGTVNYSIESCLRDPNNMPPLPTITPAQMVWLPHPALQAMTTSARDYYADVPLWVRCTLNSGAGSCVFTASQPFTPHRL